jgi:hypothetical protein
MLVRSILAAAVVVPVLAPVTPATAADVAHPPVAVLALCAPPPAALVVPVINHRFWKTTGDYQRIINVERYDVQHPPAAIVPKYVAPQTAFLASPLCQFPDGVSERSWYDGKLFYIQGGNRAAPDTFMVIERK